MRTILFLFLLMLLTFPAIAQDVPADTMVYTVVEEMPRFPGCEQLDTTLQAKNQCAQQQLLAFVYGQVTYPIEARQEEIEGTVVVSFVVEPDGSVSTPQVVREIGGGCGLEVLRVINLMNEQSVRWIPGKKAGKPVRVRMNMPVKFELEEALPYVMFGRDTVYVQFDTGPEFKGGAEALSAFLGENLDYPEVGNDSCLIGSIDLQLLIQADGRVRILNLIDYNDLGFDFWYEAIDAGTSTAGKWDIATYEGRPVTSGYDINLSFAPSVASCQEKVNLYQKANELAAEGLQLFNGDDKETGLAKMSEAVALFPNDANFLFTRGQAYLDLNRLSEACEDLRKASGIALVDWFNDILPLICR